jgi:hypothetical protein
MLSGSVPQDLVNPNVGSPAWWNYAESWAAAQTRINTFLCPSDSTSPTATLAVAYLWPTSGGACCYGSAFNSAATVAALGKTNYLAVAGYTNRPADQYPGYFANRSQVPIESAMDGSSNTLLFGEVTTNPAQAWAAAPSPKLAWTWMASPPIPTGWGGILQTPQTDYFYRFSSMHSGVVMFAMGDGAVRALKKPTVWPTIVWASATNDGQVYDFATIGN